MRRGLILGRSVMSVMKTCTLTTCSGPAPAALRHLSIAAVARSNWATTSDGILPSCAWPTTPATQTWDGVGVPGRRLAARLDTHEVHGEVFEPTAIGWTTVPSFALAVMKWCGIPG